MLVRLPGWFDRSEIDRYQAVRTGIASIYHLRHESFIDGRNSPP
jgi:hypothetical protein